MFFSTPLAFAGSIAAAGLIAAYFFRTRFKTRQVSNLMFWGSASHESGHGTRKSHLRTPFVFYLELLILAALVFAAATPLYRKEKPLPPVVLFDVSASMGAVDGKGQNAAENALKALESEIHDIGSEKLRLFTVSDSGMKNFGFMKFGDVRGIVRDVGLRGNDGELLNGVAKAKSIASGSAAVIVVTDKAPPAGYEVPQGVKWISAGSYAENTGITFACRSITADGDRLLVEIKTFPPEEKDVSFSIAGYNTPGKARKSIRLDRNGTGRFSDVLPKGTGEIVLELDGKDALDADNAAKLSSPYSKKVPVVVDVEDKALRKRIDLAVEASGLALDLDRDQDRVQDRGVGATGVVWFTDKESGAKSAAVQVVFVKPHGSGMTVGNVFALPSASIFDGVDFTGISWNTGTNSLSGDGILFCNDRAVITAESVRGGKIYRIAAGIASDTFFRTAAFPEMVWNILSEAGEKQPGAEKCEWRFSEKESDLSECKTLNLGDVSEASLTAGRVGYAAVWFGLAALALLIVHHMRWRGAWMLRAAVYILLLVALFAPSMKIRANGGTVVVVADRSDSIPGTELEAERGMIASVYAKRAEGAKTGVVSFGAASEVEDISSDGAFPGFNADVDRSASDLSGAVETALGLFEEGETGRIVLLSDGFHTGADSLDKVAELAAGKNVAIDYRLLSRPYGSDISVIDVDAPVKVGKGESVMVSAGIASDRETDAVVTFSRGSNVLYRGRKKLQKGTSRMYFRDNDVPEGMNLYSVKAERADGVQDGIPENNTAKFTVTAGVDKPLLVVPASENSALPGLLASGGAEVITVSPGNFDWSPAQLSVYSGIVVENRQADDFGKTALNNIASWVRYAGGAFVMTGGKNSFGMGGYRKSPVEDILPVSLEIKSEERKHDVAVAVVLDRSGSMGMQCGPSMTKMDLANIATVETMETLRDDDSIAVIAVDSEPHVVVPMGSVANAKEVSGKIRGISSGGGGIFVFVGLKAGIKELLSSSAKIRHLILFADASDSEQPEDYAELLVSAREVGITVSVVGLGRNTDCDAELLIDIAALGGGTCTFSEDPMEIPRLFAQDTIIMSRMALETNLVSLGFTSALSQYSDSLRRNPPQLHGYNLCYVKPDSTVMAVSLDDNKAPILATRPVGAGRTLAFTGEADGELSGPFAKWEDISEFYAAMARFCTGDGDGDDGYVVRQRKYPGGIEITAYVDSANASALATDEIEVMLLSSGGNGRKNANGKLKWKGADSLSGAFPIASSEIVLPVVTLPTGRAVRMPAVCNPYSPEYLPDEKGTGERNLKELSEKTGGKRLVNPADVWTLLPEVKKNFDLSPILYLLAAAIFVTEVILRRLGVEISPKMKNGWKNKEKGEDSSEFRVQSSEFRSEKRGSSKEVNEPESPRAQEPQNEKPASGSGLLGEASKRAGARLRR